MKTITETTLTLLVGVPTVIGLVLSILLTAILVSIVTYWRVIFFVVFVISLSYLLLVGVGNGTGISNTFTL